MKPGDRIDLEIKSVAYGGSGIARHDGIVCFVSGTIPGEIVTAEVTELRKNFARAEPLEVKSPSEHRVVPPCPYAKCHSRRGAKICPGCQYQHMDYETEIACKNNQLAELLKKFAGTGNEKMLPPVPSPSPYHYRNKLTLQIDNAHRKIGYTGEDNRTIIDIEQCILACKEINGFYSALRERFTFGKTNEKLLIRYTEENGVVAERISDGMKSAKLSENTRYGRFLVPVDSFFQVNRLLHGNLLDAYAGILRRIKPEFLIDLYCGTGIFGIIAATRSAGKVVAAEIDGNALESARINAENNKVKNISFLAGDAASLYDTAAGESIQEKTTLVLDPPRNGLDRRLLDSIRSKKPAHIIYISCGPDTLCRDLRILFESGYSIESAQMFDMFPRTAHFETVALLKLG